MLMHILFVQMLCSVLGIVFYKRFLGGNCRDRAYILERFVQLGIVSQTLMIIYLDLHIPTKRILAIIPY